MERKRLPQKYLYYDKSTTFTTDGEKVFYEGLEIPGADLDTFEPLLAGYSKDKNNVYRNRKKFSGADPLTFQTLNFTYAADSTRVWTLEGLIPEVDRATFETCDDGEFAPGFKQRIIDNGKVFDYQVIVPHGFAKDKNHVYYYDYQGKNKIIKSADPTTFVSHNDGFFAHDKNFVFCGIQKLPGANPATWKKLAERLCYSQDGERIYYAHRLMPHADTETFRPTIVTDDIGNVSNMPIAKDKNNYYRIDQVISKEEYDNFLSIWPPKK